MDTKGISSLKEGLELELKESMNKIPTSFYETYSAFSNTKGGIIYLGVKEGKPNSVQGIKNADEQRRNLFASLRNGGKVSYSGIEDSDIEIIDVDGKKLLKICVKEAPIENKPVFINGNLSLSFKRIGDGDFKMTNQEISKLLFESQKKEFDSLPNSGNFGVKDVDINSLDSYRSYLNSIKPNNIYKDLSDEDFLLQTKALTINSIGNTVLTNAGLLFFGKIGDILSLMPNYFLDYQEKDVDALRWNYRLTSDDLSMNANLWNFYEAISKRLVKDLPNPFKIRNDLSNENGDDIKRSVIEMLVNAISNQDLLADIGITIKKTIRDITYINAGHFPFEISRAVVGGTSEPRNGNIIKYFRLIEIAERAGTGIPTAMKVFKFYGFPAPSIKEEKVPEIVTVTLDFTMLPKNTPYRDEKAQILSLLSSKEDGLSIDDICLTLKKGKSMVNIIVSEMLTMGLVITNGKKTKGRKIFKA